jgi:GTPase SAR1 family protein
LTRLDISNNYISSNGLKFFSSKNFVNITDLDLSFNSEIDDKGIEFLKNSQLINLQSLNLEQTSLDYKGLYRITELPFSNTIENLALYLTNKIKYEDIPLITKKLELNCKNLKNLTYMRENMEDLKFTFFLIGFPETNQDIFKYISNFGILYLSTIGIDSKNKIVISELKIKVNIKFLITAGIERFRTLPKSYYKGADGFVLSFDMSYKASFDFVRNIAKDIPDDIKYVYLAYKKEKSEINDTEIQKILKEGIKIFYYDDENKKGIDDGIAWLADKFTC